MFRNREEEEERLRELEEDYEDDDFYSKKKKKKDNKKSSNEWTEDDYNLLVKLLNKYPGNCYFQKIFTEYVMITSLLRNAKQFEGGASNRWDRIAQDMDRNVPDVIKKAKEYQKKIHAPSNNGAGLYSSSTVKTKKTVTVKPVGGISEAIPTGPVEESKENFGREIDSI